MRLELCLAPLAAGAVALGLLPWLLRGKERLPMDHPNDRSLHQRPIPRTGGLAIMAGVAVAALLPPSASWLWLTPALLLAGLSLLDDWRGLPVGVRLTAHLAIALWLCVQLAPQAGWLIWLGLALGVVWMTNLYNFMDGSDGLAGGMAVFGFGFYGLAAGLADDWIFAATNWAVAAAALAFLLFNFHPARIFMGDAGSIPLGFLAAAFGLMGWRDGLWSAALPVLAFSPFIVDATVTLLRRMWRGEKIWRAHKSHYYQRLVRMGWSHRQLALAEYGLMVAVGATGVAVRGLDWSPALAALVVWAMIYAALGRTIDRRWTTQARRFTIDAAFSRDREEEDGK